MSGHASQADAVAMCPSEVLDDQFFMFRAKIETCNRAEPHNHNTCPFRHDDDTCIRRDPQIFKYDSIFCYDLHNTKVCRRGANCPYSHNLFEYFLHPSRYRTRMCEYGDRCTREMCFFAHNESQLRPRTGIKTYSGGRRSGRRHRLPSSAGASAGSDSGNNSPSMASLQAPTFLLIAPTGSNNAAAGPDFSAHEALSRLSLGTMESHSPQPDLLNSYVVSMPHSGLGLQQPVEVSSCMAFTASQLSTAQLSPTASIGPGGIELLPVSCPTPGLGLGLSTQGMPATVTATSHLDLQQGGQLFACTPAPGQCLAPAAPDSFYILDPASSGTATWTPTASQFAPASGAFEEGSLQVVHLPAPTPPQGHMHLMGTVEHGFLHAHTPGSTHMALGSAPAGSVRVVGAHSSGLGAGQQYMLVPVDGGPPVAAGMLSAQPQQLQLLPQSHMNLQLVSNGMSSNMPVGSMAQQPTMVLVQSRQQH